MRVSGLYRKPPVTVSADATLVDAAALMDKEAVGAVVVRGVANRVPPDARIDAVMTTDVVTLPADAPATVERRH